jgi:hypothetical protein
MYLTLAAVGSSSRTEHGHFNHAAQSKMVQHHTEFARDRSLGLANRSRAQFARVQLFPFTTQQFALPAFTSASNAHAGQPL